MPTVNPMTFNTYLVKLNQEQLVLLRDLLSHDADVLGDLIGYADDEAGDRSEWFKELLGGTLTALDEAKWLKLVKEQ